MEKLRKLEKDNLEKIIQDRLKNNIVRKYCYISVQDVLSGGKINMDNITKRVLKHFEDRIKDNKHGLSVYYSKNDNYTSISYELKFYVHEWDESKKEWFNFSECVDLRRDHLYSDCVDILTIEKIDQTIKNIENNIVYYNNLLENLDLIIEENNRIYDQYIEFLNKYSDNYYNKLSYIIESDRYY